jgi:glycosyltransferase involved in cell wall biosynthesis
MQTLPNGVDLARNQPGPVEPLPDTLVFNGALTYYANAEAMRTFAGEILPRIREQRPEVRLKITGRSDGVDLGWLPADGSVALTGYLDDVRPAVAGSWACVVPLRTGGGTRLKILEALALGTPVVATPKGAEGLEVTPEQDILIAGEPAAFAAQTVRLLGDPQLRLRLAENGRHLVEEKYGWEAIGRRFTRMVESIAGARGRRPC